MAVDILISECTDRCHERHHYAVHDVWALYLIFRNKEITQHLLNFAEYLAGLFQPVLSALCAGVAPIMSASLSCRFFFSLFDPGNSLNLAMGATVRSLAIIGTKDEFPVMVSAT